MTHTTETNAPPGPEDVGLDRAWSLPLPDGEPLRLFGCFLGMGTSELEHHTHPGPYAPRGVKCSACRWTVIRIFRESGGKREFLVYKTGISHIPGEVDLIGYDWVSSTPEVIEVLLTRRNRPNGQVAFWTIPAARAMAQAAANDPDLREAWDNRKVR